MGQASDCPHLANERIRRLNLVRGKNVVKNLLMEVGQAAASGAGGKQNGGLPNGGLANGAGK
jgi:di- and tripeptidase/Cys-Gly metallodipeptidase DUG1